MTCLTFHKPHFPLLESGGVLIILHRYGDIAKIKWRCVYKDLARCLVYDKCSMYCCCFSVAQSCPTLCNTMDCTIPGLPVPRHLPKFAQVHVSLMCSSYQVIPKPPLQIASGQRNKTSKSVTSGLFNKMHLKNLQIEEKPTYQSDMEQIWTIYICVA